ncbi:MAG: tRNA (adenosine(37)-N6)-threonylcarbamoyltransferase complex transferase subunit TsaD [Chloroflexota bacterium]
MKILGIETSCDETAAAVVVDGRTILSNVVASQIDIHREYGGVVPEVASRQHMLAIIPVVDRARSEAQVGWQDLAAVAVTKGPGLAGSLLVGLNAAKGIAFAQGLPLVGINHLEGHIYANWLLALGPGQPEPAFPLLCLIVSGGHSDLVLLTGHGRYRLLGRSIDDAAGEAFDKVARILGLGYPGGPAIQQAARGGRPNAYHLPRAWLRGSHDFSFSGLKTAVLHAATGDRGSERAREGRPAPDERARGVKLSEAGRVAREVPVADLAASFQEAMVEVLVEKTRAAAEQHGAAQVALAGGVAANSLLRQRMKERVPLPVLCPPPDLCTDNAAMVAAAGYYLYRAGRRDGWDMDVIPSLRLSSTA